jgi:hypothetical protein
MTTPTQINLTNATELGDNVVGQVVDGKLVLVIDTTVSLGPSSSGKSMMVSTTHGFARMPGGLSVSLNVIKPK